MIYSPTDAERKITEKSAVQPKLWEILALVQLNRRFNYINRLQCLMANRHNWHK